MTPNSRNRRLVTATAVLACLLIGGPAAYGAASSTMDSTSTEQQAATQDGDGLVPSSGSGGSGGGSGHEHHTSGSGASQDDSGSGSEPDSNSGSGDQGDQQDGDQQDGDQQDGDQQDGGRDDGERAPADEGSDATGGTGDADGAGSQDVLDVLATDCSDSNLIPHDGFQKAPRCVSTAFGEVAEQDRSPSLLITDAPDAVGSGEAFQIQVSTRNLVRDRFLAAGEGGYYKEASLLDGQGLQRGHFHTACRVLPNPDEAPDAAPDPQFFVATEDGGGGSTPDTVTIDVPGVQGSGELQCSSWAGDGSHRTPMMQRANQTPAFDSVRIQLG